MGTLVTVFRSTDTGAPTLSGTAGDLINVLSHCLVIGKVFSTANDIAFTDNTTEARTNISGQTPFTLFPTPATADRTYVGHSSKFTSLTFGLSVNGSAATYVWEYWNGTTWSTLTVVDGTSGFTTSGTVTWTSPVDWATTAVNAVTEYWVRVRFTGTAPTTNPTVNYITYLGWLEVQTGTNQRDYKQGPGSNGYIMGINDNGPGAATGQEARIKGFEASTSLGVGTNQFPTVAQAANGQFIRKSNALSAATRGWLVIADTRTMYLFIATTDLAATYTTTVFGDIYSLSTLPNDPGRCILIARNTENSASIAYTSEYMGLMTQCGTILVGHYLNRDFQGSASAVACGKFGSMEYVPGFQGVGAAYTVMVGSIAFKNPADNQIYVSPLWVHTSVGGNYFRGRMRGMYHWCHTAASAADGDTFTGSGDLAGKTFMVVKLLSEASVAAIETSDTWESN